MHCLTFTCDPHHLSEDVSRENLTIQGDGYCPKNLHLVKTLTYIIRTLSREDIAFFRGGNIGVNGNFN